MEMLAQPSDNVWFLCGPQNGNDGNWFVLQNILTYLCATSASSWTQYSLSVQFFYLPVFCAWLDQSITYGNSYSILWQHVVLCVDHKMAMMETGLYYKTFSCFCVWHQHHSKHDVPFLYTFINLPVFYLPWSINPCLHSTLYRCFWNYLSKLASDLWVPVCINICVS